MSVAITNDGATIKLTYSDGKVQSIYKPYNVTTDPDQARISIRNVMYGDSWEYADVTAPASTSLDNLREILESWLEGNAGQTTVSISKSNSDIAGGVNMSLPTPLGDYRFTKNLNTRYFNTLTNGAGAVTHVSTDPSAQLSVSANSDWAIISTFGSHPYYAGFPIDVEFTTLNFQAQDDVEKEICYGNRTFSAFTGYDGLKFTSRNSTQYIEVWKAGVKTNEYARANWYDPMDGTGQSGVDLGTFSTFCVFSLQWLWLGGAGVGLFAYANGEKYLATVIPWSFSESSIIITDPQKPLQAGIISTGGAGSFKFICATIKSLGVPNTDVGDERAITHNSGLTLSARGTLNAVLGVRLKSTFRGSILEPTGIDVSCTGASDLVRWFLILNPSAVASTFTYASTYLGVRADDSFEVAEGVTANTVTLSSASSMIIQSGISLGRSSSDANVTMPRRIGFDLTGVADQWILCAEKLSGGSVSIEATMTFKQKY